MALAFTSLSKSEHRLAILARNEAILPIVSDTGTDLGWWDRNRHWKRTFGRLDPAQNGYCTLVFEASGEPQEFCVVEAFDTEPSVTNSTEFCVPDFILGWLRLSRFPTDQHLHTLPQLLEHLYGVLVLRYRPGKRCTLSARDPLTGEVRFAKVFNDDRGAEIHQNGELLWQAARRGELDFDVAEPGHWDSNNRTLWQGRVPGQALVSRLHSRDGIDLAGRMGRACASLAVSSITPRAVFDADAQCRRTARYATELACRIPSTEKNLNIILSKLRSLHFRNGDNGKVPIHGAPHAHQWLDSGERLGLVDFDRISYGDPELDVATFVAEMDFEDRRAVPVDEINNAFVAGYEDVYGSLNPVLITAYRCHKHLAKALKAARSVRTDAMTKALRNLQRARAGLQEAIE